MSTTYMLYAFVFGRLLFGGYFIAHGLDHFIQFRRIRSYAAGKGVPLPALAVGGSGLLAFFGGTSILFGYLPRWGLLLLVIFLLGVTFPMHDFWNARDPEARRNEWLNFTRNTVLFGAAIMMVAIPTPWRMSLGQIQRIRSAPSQGSAQLSSPRTAPLRPASPAASRPGDTSRK